MIPDLPYPEPDGTPTAGHDGGDTSRERAVNAATDGTEAARQATTLRKLGAHGADGLTWRELAEVTGWHHGQASGVLSVLHLADRIARLAERRARCYVYVLPGFVEDRPTTSRQPRRRTLDPAELDALRALRTAVDESGALVMLHADDARALLALLERLT